MTVSAQQPVQSQGPPVTQSNVKANQGNIVFQLFDIIHTMYRIVCSTAEAAQVEMELTALLAAASGNITFQLFDVTLTEYRVVVSQADAAQVLSQLTALLPVRRTHMRQVDDGNVLVEFTDAGGNLARVTLKPEEAKRLAEELAKTPEEPVPSPAPEPAPEPEPEAEHEDEAPLD